MAKKLERQEIERMIRLSGMSDHFVEFLKEDGDAEAFQQTERMIDFLDGIGMDCEQVIQFATQQIAEEIKETNHGEN